MFDIGFSELLLIAIVALIVIGPERLPGVARTLGHLVGRMQRYVNDVKADISREMELEELRKMQSSMEDAARSMRDTVTGGISETESELNKLTQSVQPESDPFAEPAPPTPAAQQSDAAPDAEPHAPAPQQRELALDTDPSGPSRKQA